MHGLSSFFSPESVAVIGASDYPKKVASIIKEYRQHREDEDTLMDEKRWVENLLQRRSVPRNVIS